MPPFKKLFEPVSLKNLRKDSIMKTSQILFTTIISAGLLFSACDQKSNRIKGAGGLLNGTQDKATEKSRSSEKGLINQEGISGINSLSLEADYHVLENLADVVTAVDNLAAVQKGSLDKSWTAREEKSSQNADKRIFKLSTKTETKEVGKNRKAELTQSFDYLKHDGGPLESKELTINLAKTKTVLNDKNQIVFKANYMHQLSLIHLSGNDYKVEMALKKHDARSSAKDVTEFSSGSKITFDIKIDLEKKAYTIMGLTTELTLAKNRTPLAPKLASNNTGGGLIFTQKDNCWILNTDEVSVGDDFKEINFKVTDNKMTYEKTSIDLKTCHNVKDESFERFWEVVTEKVVAPTPTNKTAPAAAKNISKTK